MKAWRSLRRSRPACEAPRALRAKSTFLELAGEGGAAYAASVGVTPHALRHRLYDQDMKSRLGAYRAEDRYIKAMAEAPGWLKVTEAPLPMLKFCQSMAARALV